MSYVSNYFLCRIFDRKDLYDAERDPLAIAKFLVESIFSSSGLGRMSYYHGEASVFRPSVRLSFNISHKLLFLPQFSTDFDYVYFI